MEIVGEGVDAAEALAHLARQMLFTSNRYRCTTVRRSKVRKATLVSVIQTLPCRGSLRPALRSYFASGANHIASELRHKVPPLPYVAVVASPENQNFFF